MKNLLAALALIAPLAHAEVTVLDPISRELIETHRIGVNQPQPQPSATLGPSGRPQDVIFVVDNSGSMVEYQPRFAGAANDFATVFATVAAGWKMATITTDPGVRGPVLSPGNPLAAFMIWVNGLGANGSGTEMPLDSLHQMLTRDPSFLTPGSDLNIVIATDAPDQSVRAMPELLANLEALTGGRDIYSYLYLNAPDFGCTRTIEDPNPYAGSRYEQFAQATHGSTFPFCLDAPIDVTASARSIVSRIGMASNPTPVIDEFAELSARPDPSTIQVIHDATPVPQGFPGRGYWMYDEATNRIWFHTLSFLIPGIDTIQVRYIEKAD